MTGRKTYNMQQRKRKIELSSARLLPEMHATIKVGPGQRQKPKIPFWPPTLAAVA